MTHLEAVCREFESVRRSFLSSDAIHRLLSGSLTVAQYMAMLREIFHHTRENPQLQALAAVQFRGSQRELIRTFFKHAISEIGHDQLALNDLRTLGFDVERVAIETPLPATTALLAFGFYQVQNHNPVGYLGYLYFLEFIPTSSGSNFMTALEGLGVPSAALTFLKEHTTVDVAHNRLMHTYVESLVRTGADLDSVVYAMETTGYLYSQMLEASIRDADAPVRRRTQHDEHEHFSSSCAAGS